jgi:hypothetical protein
VSGCLRQLLAAALLGAVALSLSGCSLKFDVSGGGPVGEAECRPPGERLNGPMVLMAQAVPTATLLPCLRTTPIGWSTGPLTARRGHAEFALNSDRYGQKAVLVTLSARCDLSGSTVQTSDEPSTRRYERVERLTPAYAGSRFYVFPGGCVTYRFRTSRAGGAAETTTAASLAVSFMPRSVIAEKLRDGSDGRLELDPSRTPR